MRNSIQPDQLLRKAAARGNAKEVIRLCNSHEMDVNQASPTNRTALFNLFEYWAKKAEVKDYECILKYLCQNYNLSASWNTVSTHHKTSGKTPLDLIVENNIDISPKAIELIRINNPGFAGKIQKHLYELKSTQTVNLKQNPREKFSVSKLDAERLYQIDSVARRLESSASTKEKVRKLAEAHGAFLLFTDVSTQETELLLSPDRNLARVQSAFLALQQLKELITTINFPDGQKRLMFSKIEKIQNSFASHYFKDKPASELHQNKFDQAFDKYFKHLHKYIEQFAVHIVYLNSISVLLNYIKSECPYPHPKKDFIKNTLEKTLLRRHHILSDKPVADKSKSHLRSFQKLWKKVLRKFDDETSKNIQRVLDANLTNFTDDVLTKKHILMAIAGHVYTPLMVESNFFRDKTKQYLNQIRTMMTAEQRGILCHGKYNLEFACLLAQSVPEKTVFFQEKTDSMNEKDMILQRGDKIPGNLLNRDNHPSVLIGTHCLFNFDAIDLTADMSVCITMSPSPKQRLIRLIESLPINAQVIISLSKVNLFIAVCEALYEVNCLTYAPCASPDRPLLNRNIPNETRTRLFNQANLSLNPHLDQDSSKGAVIIKRALSKCNEHHCNLVTVVATKTSAFSL